MARGGRRKPKKQQNAGAQLEGEGLNPKQLHHAISKIIRQPSAVSKRKMKPNTGPVEWSSSSGSNQDPRDSRFDGGPSHLDLTTETLPISNTNDMNLLEFIDEIPNETKLDQTRGKRCEANQKEGFVETSPKPETVPFQVNGDNSSYSSVLCDYCAVTFDSELELNVHCQSEAHQSVVMSDGEKTWKYRPPPRGFLAGGYTLCENWDKTCRYGAQCVEAHSAEELQEWRMRYEYRHNKIQQAEQQNLLGKSYTEQLLEKWSHSSNPDSILKEKVDYAEDSLSENQLTTTVSKDSKTDWTFLIKTSRTLLAVALLQFPDRNHFSIKCIKSVSGTQHREWLPQNTNEWLIPDKTDTSDRMPKGNGNVEFKHSICIEFSSDIYGTFRQAVAFDFGIEPLMVKHLCVDVRPASFATNVEELKKELFVDERWDENNAEIIRFSCSDENFSSSFSNKTNQLLQRYPTPTPSTFTLTQSTVTERMITKNNYCSRMHELLGVEEMARYQQVARYNVRTKLNITKSYLLAPTGTAFSTAKFAQDNQLYAVMHLSQAISEDTAAGRLILSNCTSVLLCAADKSNKKKEEISSQEPLKKKVFEALIEDKGKNVIYIKLSADIVKYYSITSGVTFYAEVQFQLNRQQYCEWHHAVDSIEDYKILFPETFLEPDIPWTPQRQWKEIRGTKLNVKQKEAIVAITTPLNAKLPPVLIIGPFGTGKTYTLAQAIKQLLTEPEHRILVCTHSNSAADIYIHDYLHPYILSGHEAARPLRIYYHKRWVSTVHPIVQQYSLIDTSSGTKQFKLPSKEEVEKHRVIVVTLNMSMFLSTLNLPKGFFTHIFLDEAAQAMECEAIMPLALAGDETRIVLAGDHMQLNPELFSPFAKERNLHMSLLERLYDHYPASFPCKILLTENYRAHEAIIKFTSELFYDQKLVSSGRQPRHPKLYPLTFYSCRGEDVQEINSTGHYNLAEVYEIAERVIELKQSWPKEWGELNDQSIGIMTHYPDQVFRIRCELRRKGLGSISVERVLNVQGKQFRAILISTVRTRRTCSTGNKNSSSEESEYGFLSNSKLLNTAITRAQSLVAVVGDPIALCSLGRCRKVWEHYLKTCDENKSLFGIPWSSIQSQLDGVEFKPNYGLNPLAPEFIPMGLYSPLGRPKPPSCQTNGNDAYLFNGYQSHLTYFDQSQPGQCQPVPPYQPRPTNLEGQIFTNMCQPPYVHNTHPQQGFPIFAVQQQQTQSWPIQQDPQYRPAMLPNQAPNQAQQTCAVLLGTPKVQSTSEVLQNNTSIGGSSNTMHLMQHSPRLWPGTARHIVPQTAINMTAKPYDTLAGKVLPSGKMGVPGIELFSNSVGSGKVNGVIFNNGGYSGSNSPLQHLPINTIQMEAVQPVQQPHQSHIPQNGVQPFMNCQPLASHQQSQPQAMLPQLAQLQPQGMQSSALHQQGVQSVPYHLIPNRLGQPPIVQNAQPHTFVVQNPHIFQQQQHQLLQHMQQQLPPHKQKLQQHMQQQQQLQQLQQQQQLHQLQQQRQQPQQPQPHPQPQPQAQPQPQPQLQLRPQLQPQPQFQSVLHEQQLRLPREQWQQDLAILLEQRKLLLGHILTPLVNCNPEWNKLIPRGINLLDMVDNEQQQEEWFDHLVCHGQADLAKRFANFMMLCVRTITAVMSEHKQASTHTLLGSYHISDQNNERTVNTKQNVVGMGPATSGPKPNIHPGSSRFKPAGNVDIGSVGTGRESDEMVIMMKDLDPTYMLGSDPLLNGRSSVWAIAQDELEHCSRNGSRMRIQSKTVLKSVQKPDTFDSDDSGDELLSSINRQLDLQHTDE